MADQGLARKDVWYCFKTVRDLIKRLPKETVIGDSSWASEKGKINEALELLENFFKTFSEIKKSDINEFMRIKEKHNEVFDMACGLRHATITLDQSE